VRGDARGGLDANVRHLDPSWPSHLQAAPAVRSLRGPRRLQLLRAPDAFDEHASAPAVESARQGLTREHFTALVEDALRDIPRRFRDAMANVAVVVEEEPSAALLAEMGVGPDDDLFGLYQGIPLPERGWSYGNALPDRISIYQIPIEDACEDEDEIRDCVAETVIHEFGHYFGMSEEEIEEIEEKYWRGESLDDV
jgi:predicted Zn-dependent protease with MMP-like domain